MKKFSGKMKIGSRRICVTVGEETVAKTVAVASQMGSLADVIEIRLDAIGSPVVQEIAGQLPFPLLFTNRPVWEGGDYAGEEADRVNFLLEAIQAKAAFVDIELKTEAELFRKVLDAAAVEGVTSIIVSWHDFKGTPSSQALVRIFQEQYRSGAQIGKIVTMAHTFPDVLRILELQVMAAEMDFPLIAFCMGRAGLISRIATLELGGFMSYAAPDAQRAAAPGQLPIASMRAILENLDNGD